MQSRILFTARDVGAAQQIEVIYKYFTKNRFHTTLLASGAALNYFQIKNIDAQPFFYDKNKYTVLKNASRTEIEKLLHSAHIILLENKPDAIICGLSTFHYGIDEAILYWANSNRDNIPSFQFLETWGTFNHIDDGLPDMYLGFDKATQDFIKKEAQTPIIIVGSPKHDEYKNLPVEKWRNEFPETIRIQTQTTKIIGFFAQSPEIPGQLYNFTNLVESLRNYQKKSSCKLLFREHPNSIGQYSHYWKVIEKHNIDAIDVTKEKIVEKLISICDIVATCYSTVAIDHAFLCSYGNCPVGVSLYLLCGNEIKDFLLSEYGYWKNPILERGVGFFVEDHELLTEKINMILTSNQFAKEYYFNSKALQHYAFSCDNIQKIVSDFIRKRH